MENRSKNVRDRLIAEIFRTGLNHRIQWLVYISVQFIASLISGSSAVIFMNFKFFTWNISDLLQSISAHSAAF